MEITNKRGRNMKTEIKQALGKSAMTPTQLAEKLGISLDELVIAVAENGGVRPGAKAGTLEAKRRGRPSGRSKVVGARVEQAKSAILELKGGGATVADVVARLGGNVESRDVKEAARELVQSGEIIQTKRGRQIIFLTPISA